MREGLMLIGGGNGVGLYGHEVRLGEAGELFEVLEVTSHVFKEVFVVLGRGGRLRVVVTMVVAAAVVARGAATTGGAVLFGHLGADEHHQEGRRGVGRLGALEEHDFEHVGVTEDGYFESPVEAEGVVGLPLPGGSDGYVGLIGGEADGAGAGKPFEIDGLPNPRVAVFGSEVIEADAEVAFELGGFVFGVDAEFLDEGGHGCWVLGARCWEERREYCVGV